ncbi:PDZ domain-containing protein [Latilactobacillus graminis]|nr:PDZ domain-containing protein [Latilactobacillus graminis]
MTMIIDMLQPFFTAPLLWLAVIYAVWLAQKRVRRERKTFRIAINPRWVEVGHFVGHGLLAGFILSCCTLVLGSMVNMEWWLIYEIIAILSLLVAAKWQNTSATFLISALVYLGATQIWPQYQVAHQNSLLAELLVTIGLVTISNSALQRWDAKATVTPNVVTSKRGRATAFFTSRQIYIAPVFFLVPGAIDLPKLGFWPILNIGHQSYSLVILPLLLGYSLKAVKGLMKAVIVKHANSYLIFGFLLVGAGLITVVLPNIIIEVLIVALGLSFAVQWRLNRRSIREEQIHFTKPYNGVFILGILRATPAAKMGLMVGDTIIECNGQAVSTNDNFYQAIQSQPTYCHLKVQDLNGEFRMAEGAIFADAPHELGVVLFPEN